MADPDPEQIGFQEFVRRFKYMIAEQGALFAFFLGAGTSISSNIPGAKFLVDQWIPKLFQIKTGGTVPDEGWVEKTIKGYKPADPAAFYAAVMRTLFRTPAERQREIERIVMGADPAFGYAVLATP